MPSALESGLAKLTLCASSFAWMHGKPCVRGFQVKLFRRSELMPARSCTRNSPQKSGKDSVVG